MNAKKSVKKMSGRADPMRELRRAKNDVSRARREIEPKKAEKQKRKNVQRGPQRVRNLEGKFMECMKYPDLTGPQIFPIQGAGDQVVTGYSRGTYDLANSLANGTAYGSMFFLQPSNVGQNGAIVNAALNGTFANNYLTTSWGLSFPANNQVLDYVVTSGCITVEYIGSEQSTSGTVLVGTLPITFSTFNTTTYATLAALPGTLEIPVTDLLRNGMIRVPLTHQGPNSWTYIPTSTMAQGLACPFVVVQGTTPTVLNASNVAIGPIGGVRVVAEMNWQAHPADTVNGVPYDSGPRNYTSDSDAFQNAIAKLGTTALDLISLGFPEISVVRNLLPEWKDISPLFSKSKSGALRSVSGLRVKRLQQAHPCLKLHDYSAKSDPEPDPEEPQPEMTPAEHIQLASQLGTFFLSPKSRK